MNPRMTTIVVGVIILALGLAGLFYPDRLMAFLGFSILKPSEAAAALGEIRANYGGLFTVMGALTIFAGMNPRTYRRQILVVSVLWLGACAGRLLGVWQDGNPGLPGWIAVAFELLVGGALLASWWNAPKELRPPAPAPTPRPAAEPYRPPAESNPPPPIQES